MIRLKKWWYLSALPLLAVFIAALITSSQTFRAYGDFALIELQSREVFTARTPLTGLFGRMLWNHPGPAMFWLLSPAAILAHRTSTPLRVEYLLLIGITVIASLALAWRLGRKFFTAITIVTALSLVGIPTAVLTAYWNPWFPIPMFLLLFVLSAGVAAGQVKHLIGIVVVGSVMVQTHVGTLAIVATCALFSIVCIAVDALRSRKMPEKWRSTLGWCAGLLTAIWLMPVIGVIRHVHGNLISIGRYFLDAPGGHTGLSRTLQVFAGEYLWRPTWLGGPERIDPQAFGIEQVAARISGPSLLILLVPLVFLGVGFFLSRSRSDARWSRYILLVTSLLCMGALAISRGDQPIPHTFGWITLLAPLAILIPLVPIVDWVLSRRPKVAILVALLSLVVITVAAFGAAPRYRTQGDALLVMMQPRVKSLSKALDIQKLQDRRIAVRQDWLGPFDSGVYSALVNEMSRRGAKVIVAQDAWAKRSYGDSRSGPSSSAPVVWYFIVTPERFAELRSRPGARVIWYEGGSTAVIEVPSKSDQQKIG